MWWELLSRPLCCHTTLPGLSSSRRRQRGSWTQWLCLAIHIFTNWEHDWTHRSHQVGSSSQSRRGLASHWESPGLWFHFQTLQAPAHLAAKHPRQADSIVADVNILLHLSNTLWNNLPHLQADKLAKGFQLLSQLFSDLFWGETPKNDSSKSYLSDNLSSVRRCHICPHLCNVCVRNSNLEFFNGPFKQKKNSTNLPCFFGSCDTRGIISEVAWRNGLRGLQKRPRLKIAKKILIDKNNYMIVVGYISKPWIGTGIIPVVTLAIGLPLAGHIEVTSCNFFHNAITFYRMLI